jgi:hypothetical protein
MFKKVHKSLLCIYFREKWSKLIRTLYIILSIPQSVIPSETIIRAGRAIDAANASSSLSIQLIKEWRVIKGLR